MDEEREIKVGKNLKKLAKVFIGYQQNWEWVNIPTLCWQVLNYSKYWVKKKIEIWMDAF